MRTGYIDICSHMNPSWTRIYVQTSFNMVHTDNLQWHARNLVRIGLHGSLTDVYANPYSRSLFWAYPHDLDSSKLWIRPPMAGPITAQLPLLYFLHVGHIWNHLGSVPPMHVPRAWGGMEWVPHVLGSLPRSDKGLGVVWVSRVAYLSVRLTCSPILTRFRVGHCKFTVCTI